MSDWLELRLPGLPRDALDSVSTCLFDHGASGLQEDHMPGQQPRLRQLWDAHAPDPPPDPLLLRAWFQAPDRTGLEQALAQLTPISPCWCPVPNEDWETSWRRGLEPVVISERLIVAPPWEEAPPHALRIEPGQDYGTGAHATTQAALRAIDQLAPELLAGGSVPSLLDVGCGTGILALAAARLGLDAEGIDVDPHAVATARAHGVLNGMDRIPFSTTPLQELEHPFDLVVANLHAEIIVALAADLRRLTRQWLILAGILLDREPIVRGQFDPHFLLHHRACEGSWVALRYHTKA